ncbi:hypothetical protein [Microbacterium sp. NIBRBAC000506063]|uniref:hypothetical protein n=1 Tax=Microbacterium sp. NIBRBAC000506063 TaxID=2734618 RepID=UPI00398037D5
MSLGAQYQHRGVTKVERLSGTNATTGLTLKQVRGLLTRPSWVSGTLMLGTAIICQLGALWVAPLIVVQPLGALALVITTLLNARVSGHAPHGSRSRRSSPASAVSSCSCCSRRSTRPSVPSTTGSCSSSSSRCSS